VQYNPNKWTGDHFQEIFAEILEANNTVSKGLVRVLDDIKFEQFVTTMGGDIPLQAYSDDPQTPSDSIKFADAVVSPKKLMAHTRFTPEQLRSTRFNKDMKSGAANIASNEFETVVINYSTLKISKSFITTFWSSITSAGKAAVAASSTATASQKAWAAAQPDGFIDGIVAELILSGKAIAETNAAFTATNLKTVFEKAYAKIPTALHSTDDKLIYAPHSVKPLIDVANTKETYRDLFVVSGGNYSYLGIQIEFVEIPDNSLVIGRSSDLVLATDLLSDVGSLEVGKVNNEGDKMFIKGVMTLDAAVLVPEQKVLFM